MDRPSWLKRKKPGIKDAKKRDVPDGLWRKCEDCGEIIYHKEFEKNHPANESMPYVLFQIGRSHYRTIDTVDREQ